MPSSFDLPRRDKRALGEILAACISTAKSYDLAPAYTQAIAVQNYLNGNRNFDIEDPWDPTYILLTVETPRNQPFYEAVVSDVAQEIGRQQRMDVTPNTRLVDTTMNATRDAAVSLGMLRYLFPDRSVDRPHRAFQKYRVEDGCAAMAVEETMYPSRGWGLKLTPVPVEEIVFLPVGLRSAAQVEMPGWRRWVTMRFLKGEVSKLSMRTGRKIRIPGEGTEGYDKMRVRRVRPGGTVKDMGRGIVQDAPLGSMAGRGVDGGYAGGDSYSPTDTEFVEWTRAWVTRDHQHVEREIWLAGEFILYDEEFPESEQPQIPFGIAPYADVGGPYGRSFAFSRMMMNIMAERMLCDMSDNASKIRLYGIVTYPSGVGMNTEQMMQEGDGYTLMKYNGDPTAAGMRPEQIAPAPLSRIYGNLPQMILGAGQQVFPQSPLLEGRATGRVDSEVAIRRLDLLSNTQIAAGMQSARAAIAQCYRAGLEMARRHYKAGDSIPLVYLGEEMAGVVLDTAPIPLSSEEQELVEGERRKVFAHFADQGLDPFAGSVLAREGIIAAPQLDPNIMGMANRAAPIGRFKIGPNVIPHPDDVDIDIMSWLPRDKDAEFMQIMSAVNPEMPFASIMEAQIEVYKRGLDKWVGGRAVWNTYRAVMLNLLSAFGDGVESGPIIIGDPFTQVRQVGFWVCQTFMAGEVFALASDTCKRKIMQVASMYDPVNMPAQMLTADEAAAQHMQLMSARAKGQRGGMLPMRPPAAA